MRRAPARYLRQKHLDDGGKTTDEKKTRAFSDGKEKTSVQVWAKSVGYHGQPLAPYTMDLHAILEVVIYIH